MQSLELIGACACSIIEKLAVHQTSLCWWRMEPNACRPIIDSLHTILITVIFLFYVHANTRTSHVLAWSTTTVRCAILRRTFLLLNYRIHYVSKKIISQIVHEQAAHIEYSVRKPHSASRSDRQILVRRLRRGHVLR